MKTSNAKRYHVTVEEHESYDDTHILRAAQDVLMDDRLILEMKDRYINTLQDKESTNERQIEIVCMQYLMDNYVQFKSMPVEEALTTIKEEKLPKLWMREFLELQNKSILNQTPFLDTINEFIDLIDGKVVSDVFRYRVDLYTDADVVARMTELSKIHYLYVMVETEHEDGTKTILHYDNGSIYNHEVVQHSVRMRDLFTIIKGEK